MPVLFATDASDALQLLFGGSIVGGVIAIVTMMRRESRKDDSAAVKKWKDITAAQSVEFASQMGMANARIKELEGHIVALLARDRENVATIATLTERLRPHDKGNTS